MLSDLFKGHGLDVAHHIHSALFLKIHGRHFLGFTIWKKKAFLREWVFSTLLYTVEILDSNYGKVI